MAKATCQIVSVRLGQCQVTEIVSQVIICASVDK